MITRTLIVDVEQDKVTDGNFSGPFDEISAKQLSSALEKNKKLTKLDLSYCLLTDDEFTLLAEALLKRKITLELLNIEFNDLTSKSIPIILKLMESAIVKTIFLKNHELLADSSGMNKINEAAKKYKVEVSVEGPLERKKAFRMMLSKQNESIVTPDMSGHFEHKDQNFTK